MSVCVCMLENNKFTSLQSVLSLLGEGGSKHQEEVSTRVAGGGEAASDLNLQSSASCARACCCLFCGGGGYKGGQGKGAQRGM
jgi:hypothetical protein